MYDSLDRLSNHIDKTTIKLNNIDIMASLKLQALASTVYTKSEIHTGLNLNSDKSNTYFEKLMLMFLLSTSWYN